MVKGPKGQKRPGEVVGAAVHVAKIATGEIEDTGLTVPGRAKGGKIGGKARAEKLSAQERSNIASRAAKARWHKDK